MSVSPDIKFEDIFREYRPRIYRYLVRLVGEYEAEDLAQEVFVKARSKAPDDLLIRKEMSDCVRSIIRERRKTPSLQGGDMRRAVNSVEFAVVQCTV